MLKLYTEPSYLTPEYRKRIFPILLDLHYLKDERAGELFELVDQLEDCNIAVFPTSINSHLHTGKKHLIEQFIQQANQHKKPVWLYSAGDVGITYAREGVTVFRLGGFHSKMDPQTEIFPSFIVDPLAHQLQRPFEALDKKEQPDIGFVGHAQGGWRKWMKEYMVYVKFNTRRFLGKHTADRMNFFPSAYLRAKYLQQLAGSTELDTQFVFRSKYRAGAHSPEQRAKTTQEFFQNIFDHTYTFCIRGLGNFSVRLYETLAMGRIPILIDTDCRLPLHYSIDWKQHCLMIPHSEVRHMVKRIVEFHQNLSEEELKNLQQANRNLWLEKLSRIGYFTEIHHKFQNQESSA